MPPFVRHILLLFKPFIFVRLVRLSNEEFALIGVLVVTAVVPGVDVDICAADWLFGSVYFRFELRSERM